MGLENVAADLQIKKLKSDLLPLAMISWVFKRGIEFCIKKLKKICESAADILHQFEEEELKFKSILEQWKKQKYYW